MLHRESILKNHLLRITSKNFPQLSPVTAALISGCNHSRCHHETQSVQQTCQELVSGPPPLRAPMKITFFTLYLSAHLILCTVTRSEYLIMPGNANWHIKFHLIQTFLGASEVGMCPRCKWHQAKWAAPEPTSPRACKMVLAPQKVRAAWLLSKAKNQT